MKGSEGKTPHKTRHTEKDRRRETLQAWHRGKRTHGSPPPRNKKSSHHMELVCGHWLSHARVIIEQRRSMMLLSHLHFFRDMV